MPTRRLVGGALVLGRAVVAAVAAGAVSSARLWWHVGLLGHLVDIHATAAHEGEGGGVVRRGRGRSIVPGRGGGVLGCVGSQHGVASGDTGAKGGARSRLVQDPCQAVGG